MKYFSIAFLLTVFVILYVWQNVEVMKIRMDFRRLNKTKQELVMKNDRIRYDIERYRHLDIIAQRAEKQGRETMKPTDVVVLVAKEKK